MTLLLVVSGPSGAGKRTIVEKLQDYDPKLHLAISCTTRVPKNGEVNGRDYHFITREEFLNQVHRGEFAEWADVHGNLYGTPKRELRSSTGFLDIILEIDCRGAFEIKEKHPCARTIFLLPPSFDVLEHRIRKRGRGESEGEIRIRLLNAKREIYQAKRFDHWIVNGNLNAAVGNFKALIKRLRADHMSARSRSIFRNQKVLERVLRTVPK